MTVKQAAAELGVSAGLVYQLCAQGKIRHERHGLGVRGAIRITSEALKEYREKCSRGGAEAVPPPPRKKKPKLNYLRLPS